MKEDVRHSRQDDHAGDQGQSAAAAKREKVAELVLPYHKQGADLAAHLEATKTVGEALERHASQMDHAAAILRATKLALGDQPVTIDANTHCIVVSGPTDVIDSLIGKDLLTEIEDLADDGDEPSEDPSAGSE